MEQLFSSESFCLITISLFSRNMIIALCAAIEWLRVIFCFTAVCKYDSYCTLRASQAMLHVIRRQFGTTFAKCPYITSLFVVNVCKGIVESYCTVELLSCTDMLMAQITIKPMAWYVSAILCSSWTHSLLLSRLGVPWNASL